MAIKVLHTADWHLGAYLGPYSRIAEQRHFLAQLCDIVEQNGVQLVLVAGDIFDTANPPAAAEQLFYDVLARLAALNATVVLIAGNHDSPERLIAPAPLAEKLGIITFVRPGVSELIIGGQKVVIAAMPFISEKRLNEAIFSSVLQSGGEQSEQDMQKEFSGKVGRLFASLAEKFRQDSINIAMGHFHLRTGKVSGGLERDILLGGSFAVNQADLPACQYIAMGHLHRAQKVGAAHYAGSPLPYSLSERHPKSVYLVEIAPNSAPLVEKILLDCPKPVELWQVATAAEAIVRCRIPSNSYVYIHITDEMSINLHDIKEMHNLKKDIVQISLAGAEIAEFAEIVAWQENPATPREEFVDFYSTVKGVEPKPELLSIFDEILVQFEGVEAEGEGSEAE
jgi:exonuclease SbcD